MLIDQTINTTDFEALLDEAFRRAGREGRPVLASYDLPLAGANLSRRVHQLGVLRNRLFYWKSGDGGMQAVGAGSALGFTAEGPGRFDHIRRQAEEWRGSFVTNMPPEASRRQPVLLGAASFFPRLETTLWADFAAAEWVVPEMLLYRNGRSTRAALQFLIEPESDREELIRTCERRLALLDDDFSGQAGAGLADLFLAEPPVDGHQTWNRSVRTALDAIKDGSYEKIVLSRMTETVVRASIDPADWLSRLTARYPECHLFLLRRGESSFFGASPERLVKIENGRAFCNAMAGSTGRGATDAEDGALGKALLRSAKNRREHGYVVAHVRDVIGRFCAGVQVDEAPSLRKLPYIQHLYSHITGRLQPTVSPVTLAGSLHPTPAVGGFPVEQALEAMRRLETYDRGLYGGFAGWFNFDGEGDFCVSIRSALAKGRRLYSFAGAGIVEGSDPDAEFDETEIKLRAIASLLSS